MAAIIGWRSSSVRVVAGVHPSAEAREPDGRLFVGGCPDGGAHWTWRPPEAPGAVDGPVVERHSLGNVALLTWLA